jgi:hypothetical protein
MGMGMGMGVDAMKSGNAGEREGEIRNPKLRSACVTSVW